VKVNSLIEVSSSQDLTTNRTTSLQRSTTFCKRISKIFRSKSNETKSVSFFVIKKDLTKTSFILSLDITGLIPRFTNIRELSVTLPFDKHLDFIPKLDHLISLNVTLSANYTNQSHLKVLLDRAPNLYSLSVACPSMLVSKFFLADLKNVWIRKLSLPAIASFDKGIFYNIKQCIELACSPLGKQCEILSIGVQNKECIIYLINKMINLRLLIVTTFDNYIPSSSSPEEFYELITWLKLTLPSTIKIIKYDCCTRHIHFCQLDNRIEK
jgi:hypothetical protein